MLRIYPSSSLDAVVLGEEYAYELDCTQELGSKTVSSYSYKIYDNAGDEVTDSLGGGSSILLGTITFGIKAAATGKYTLKFIITCNDVLPDGITPYEFYVTLTVAIN
jgi:hypothetical protein